MVKKSWEDFSPKERRQIYAAAAIEVVMTTVAIADLSKRSASDVRGPKWAWVLSFVIQPFGPIAYFALGRRRTR